MRGVHFIAKMIIIFFFYEKIPAVALAEDLLSAPQQPHADQTVIKREQALLQDEPRPPPQFRQAPIIILTQRSRIIFFELARSFLHNHHPRAAEAQIKTGPQQRDRAVEPATSQAPQQDQALRLQHPTDGLQQLQIEAEDAAHQRGAKLRPQGREYL